MAHRLQNTRDSDNVRYLTRRRDERSSRLPSTFSGVTPTACQLTALRGGYCSLLTTVKSSTTEKMHYTPLVGGCNEMHFEGPGCRDCHQSAWARCGLMVLPAACGR